MSRLKKYHHLQPLEGEAQGSAVALGFFDGVHLGHQDVIRTAVKYAEANGLEPAVFTFSLPVQNTLKGGRIDTEEEKFSCMQKLGVQHYMEPAFEDFRNLSPEQFVLDVLCGLYKAKALFCGDNFTFGKKAAGNVELLRQLCEPRGVKVCVVPMAVFDSELISSTRIRHALGAGNMPLVNALLGRPYAISFPVQHGQGLGSKLGFPTINQIYPEGFVMPRFGIYITRVLVNGKWYPSATGMGTRPTVNNSGQMPTCETFIPDFSGQLYCTSPWVEFYKYIAPSRKFDSLDALKECVFNAADEAREFFKNPPEEAVLTGWGK